MKRIVLISCVSRKGKAKSKAKDLYRGSLFSNSLKYAHSINPDKIYILSALYHLLELDTEIEPYDVTLSYITPAKRRRKPHLKILTKEEARAWGIAVVKQLSKVADLKKDKFIILAGQAYLEPIRHSLINVEEPLKGVVMGKRPVVLKNLMKLNQ